MLRTIAFLHTRSIIKTYLVCFISSIVLMVLCFFIIRGNTSVQAQQLDLNSIEIGQSSDALIAQLGAPLKITTRDNLQVLWYNSVDPLDADFIYTLNNQIVMKAISVRKTKNQLEDYIGRYGLPEVDQKKFKDSIEDPFLFTMHIWFNKGVMTQTSGEKLSSSVMRVFQFTPMAQNVFYQTVAPDLFGNSLVKIDEEPINRALAAVIAEQENAKTQTQAQVSATPSELPISDEAPLIDIILPIAIAVVGILALLALVYALSRSNKATPTPPLTPPVTQ